MRDHSMDLRWQCSIMSTILLNQTLTRDLRNSPIADRAFASLSYQLRLKPALMLLLVAPDGVSPTEPEIVTPSVSFCSAPTLRSHLSSVDDRLCPAVTLVPVSPMSSLADWSVP